MKGVIITMISLSDCRHIHCIGVGGIGLSGIAEILKSRGYEVSGSDMRESDTTERLLEHGIRIFLGHRGKNVENADLVIYSTAVSKDNPELKRAKELGIPTMTRAEMLGILMEEYKTSIAISGTHGKTTTTSMISLILNRAQMDPTILVGGNLGEFGGNVRVGESQFFVTEACEYMDAFLSSRPRIEIILNIDSDHLDYFKDIEHIANSFREFAKRVPDDGVIIAYDANPFVRSIVKDMDNVITFGFSDSCDYSVEDVIFNSSGNPQFYVNYHGMRLCTVMMSIPGEHNILNALAAIACCHYLGVDVSDIVETLEEYKGTQRRFDIMGTTNNNIKLIDDYAHHPTEIKATLDAVSNMKYKNLWVLFQPHTYTRTMALFDEFAESFERADVVVLAEIYAAREKNIHKISSESLVKEIKKDYPRKEVYFYPDFEEMANFVYENAEPGDLVITMGAGDIYKVGERILEIDREAYKGGYSR